MGKAPGGAQLREVPQEILWRAPQARRLHREDREYKFRNTRVGVRRLWPNKNVEEEIAMHTFYRHDLESSDDWDPEAEHSDLEPFPEALLEEEDPEGPWIEVAKARRGGKAGCSPTGACAIWTTSVPL